MEIRYPWRTGHPHSGPPPCWASQCGSQASAPFSPSLMSPLKQKNVIPFFDYVFHVKWFSDVVNSICAFGKKKWTRKLFWTPAKHINPAYLHLLLLDIYRLRLLYYITFQESPYKGYPPFLAPCWDTLSPTYQSWDQKCFPTIVNAKTWNAGQVCWGRSWQWRVPHIHLKLERDIRTCGSVLSGILETGTDQKCPLVNDFCASRRRPKDCSPRGGGVVCARSLLLAILWSRRSFGSQLSTGVLCGC